MIRTVSICMVVFCILTPALLLAQQPTELTWTYYSERGWLPIYLSLNEDRTLSGVCIFRPRDEWAMCDLGQFNLEENLLIREPYIGERMSGEDWNRIRYDIELVVSGDLSDNMRFFCSNYQLNDDSWNYYFSCNEMLGVVIETLAENDARYALEDVHLAVASEWDLVSARIDVSTGDVEGVCTLGYDTWATCKPRLVIQPDSEIIQDWEVLEPRGEVPDDYSLQSVVYSADPVATRLLCVRSSFTTPEHVFFEDCTEQLGFVEDPDSMTATPES
ncbi:MAG: hypothetical protein IPM16_19850 [Chloroflexi bacterium]|nr:hypothetical protein [Chloroflexota bacterium]